MKQLHKRNFIFPRNNSIPLSKITQSKRIQSSLTKFYSVIEIQLMTDRNLTRVLNTTECSIINQGGQHLTMKGDSIFTFLILNTSFWHIFTTSANFLLNSSGTLLDLTQTLTSLLNLIYVCIQPSKK